MKYFYLIIFVFSISFSYSQKIELNTVDEFTKTKKIFVSTVKGKHWKPSDDAGKGIFNNLYISSRYTKSSDNEQVLLVFNITIYNTQCFNNQSTVILKLDNEELLTFKHIDNVECESNSINGFFLFEGTIEDQKETLKKLATQNINKVRINFTETYQDIEIITEKHDIIKEHFRILLEEINNQ